MRQAGRYLPAYRAVRAQASFLDLCRTPELACEVTLQPIDEFGFDAAILFSDILITLPAMGIDVAFPEAGPEDRQRRCATRAAIDALARARSRGRAAVHARGDAPDQEGARRARAADRLRRRAADDADLRRRGRRLEGLRAHQEAAVRRARRTRTRCSTSSRAPARRSSRRRSRAGADCVQIFDSWGGIVSPGDFREYPLRYAKQVIAHLRTTCPRRRADHLLRQRLRAVPRRLRVERRRRARRRLARGHRRGAPAGWRWCGAAGQPRSGRAVRAAGGDPHARRRHPRRAPARSATSSTSATACCPRPIPSTCARW